MVFLLHCGRSDGNAGSLVSGDRAGRLQPWWRAWGAGSPSAPEPQLRTRLRCRRWPSQESAAAPGKWSHPSPGYRPGLRGRAMKNTSHRGKIKKKRKEKREKKTGAAKIRSESSTRETNLSSRCKIMAFTAVKTAAHRRHMLHTWIF